MIEPASPFAARLRTVARVLRWSVGAMVAAFAIAWIAATREAGQLVRAAMVLGALGFLSSTMCFVWLAYQAATRRPRRGTPPS